MIDPYMFVYKPGRAPRTKGWEFVFYVEVKSKVWTLRCKHYVVCMDIAYVMAAGSGVFQSCSSTHNMLHRAGKQLDDSTLHVSQRELGYCNHIHTQHRVWKH